MSLPAKCPSCFGEKASCDRCGGSGTVAVTIASGIWYSRDCVDCKMHIGVCIVGENAASYDEVRVHPEDLVCPFCDGQAVYTTEQEVDDLAMYRQPIRYEEPRLGKEYRRILSQRLHRPRRSIPRSLKSLKHQMRSLFR